MNSGIKILLSCAAASLMAASANAQPSLPDSLETLTMPLSKVSSRSFSTGSAYTVTAEELAKYPSMDLHNMLQAIFPGLDITEKSGDPAYNSYANDTNLQFVSNTASSSLRGATDKLVCVIDDALVPLNLVMIEPEQIESITLLTDIADKAKYGPLASYGVLLITTKSGDFAQKAQTNINVKLESGAGFSDIVPEWVNATEYATMNNIARITAGYIPLYENANALAFSGKDDLKYPNADYRSLLMTEIKPMHKAGIMADGGGQNFKYVIGINGAREGGIYNFDKNDYNRVNFMSRVTTKVGRYITASVGFLGNFSIYRSPYLSYTNYRDVPAAAYPLVLGSFDGDAGETGILSEEGDQIYAVSTQFTNNYYALLRDGGFQTNRSRSGVFNVSLDYDLSFLIKGLKSRTYFNFDSYQAITLGKKNDYLAYFWDPQKGVGDLTSHKGEKASSRSSSGNSSYQETFFYQNLNYSLEKGDHHFSADATYMLGDARSKDVTSYFLRHIDGLFGARYSYKGIYNVEGQFNYDGSARFLGDKRYAAFPSAGASWNPARYKFINETMPWLGSLRLWGQYGKMGLSGSVYGTGLLYDAQYTLSSGMTYGPVSAGRWFGNETTTSKSTNITRLSNYDLTWEQMTELDYGVEVRLFDKLYASMTFFDYTCSGLITEISSKVPKYFGIGSINAYDNNDATRYYGWEAMLNWKDRFGDLRVDVTAMASHATNIRTVVGTDTYIYTYNRATGRPSTTIFGFECLGKFQSEEEIASSALYTSDTHVGDLKYRDINGDGVINSNDQTVIGNSAPKLRYAIRLKLGYRDFDMTLVGSGRYGADFMANGSYFWNGWGDSNYSAFVRDNIGGDYPALSYTKRGGNFVASDFWLRNSDFFKIQNVEVGYSLPLSQNNKAGLGGVRLTIRGANLLTFTGLDYVDPEAPSSGVDVAPLYRTFTIGANISF